MQQYTTEIITILGTLFLFGVSKVTHDVLYTGVPRYDSVARSVNLNNAVNTCLRNLHESIVCA